MSGLWPVGSGFPRPAGRAAPWVSSETGRGGACCPRTRSSGHRPLRSDTRPNQERRTFNKNRKTFVLPENIVFSFSKVCEFIYFFCPFLNVCLHLISFDQPVNTL